MTGQLMSDVLDYVVPACEAAGIFITITGKDTAEISGGFSLVAADGEVCVMHDDTRIGWLTPARHSLIRMIAAKLIMRRLPAYDQQTALDLISLLGRFKPLTQEALEAELERIWAKYQVLAPELPPNPPSFIMVDIV